MGWVTPYAAVRVGAYFTPAYSESGTGDFALDYDARTTTSIRTELGARFAHTVALRYGTTLGLNSRIAWAHDFGSNPQMTAGFQGLPGSSFKVNGAESPRDWLLLSAGAEFGFGNGFAVAGIFDGAFAENAETWSGTAKVSYRW
jgi:outer membrane autotransporter protein